MVAAVPVLPTYSLSSGIVATTAAQPETGAGERRDRGIEKTMMSTLLGMLMMMPVVFGVGGYVLVSRRA